MNEKLYGTIIEHGPLVIAVIGAYWWATPRLVKSALRNGGGTIVRQIVREVNAEQTEHHKVTVEKAIAEHEAREFRQYGDLGEKVATVRENVASLSARLADHLARAA